MLLQNVAAATLWLHLSALQPFHPAQCAQCSAAERAPCLPEFMRGSNTQCCSLCQALQILIFFKTFVLNQALN